MAISASDIAACRGHSGHTPAVWNGHFFFSHLSGDFVEHKTFYQDVMKDLDEFANTTFEHIVKGARWIDPHHYVKIEKDFCGGSISHNIFQHLEESSTWCLVCSPAHTKV